MAKDSEHRQKSQISPQPCQSPPPPPNHTARVNGQSVLSVQGPTSLSTYSDVQYNIYHFDKISCVFTCIPELKMVCPSNTETETHLKNNMRYTSYRYVSQPFYIFGAIIAIFQLVCISF